jgi:hypothetical protein
MTLAEQGIGVQRKVRQPGAGVLRLKKYQALAHRITWPAPAEIRWRARHHWCRTPRHYSASLGSDAAPYIPSPSLSMPPPDESAKVT